ncbi:MAG: DUF2975 domain-containing protein [Vicinamibacterales bacterium]|jgi:hypothetical protein|nr:DUF2975 domain-containing protein [Vicinamibacterales bacterium]
METDERIARIKVLSRRLRWVVWGTAALCGFAVVVTLLIATGLPVDGASISIGGDFVGDNQLPLDQVSGPGRFLLALPFLPSMVIVFAVLRLGDRLLKLYEQGKIFGAANARIIHQSGKLLVALALVNAVASPIAQAIGAGSGLPIDDISIDLQTGLLLIGVAIIFVGHIMSIGAEMAEDRALTI